MRAAGDSAGEAKAHYVHALALERLGRIGQAERTFDVALAAARTAGDRRLQDAILAGAPVAALWGPSPVTRASGRCLDVVRVLRITNGAPAVEAVALRCQAALEALRGRMDAARRMVGSAHRTIEELGLAHRLLENEMTAGLIELLDGQAAAAEEHLRPAFEALRDRGLGGEAGQAASMLARALLIQGRDEEAEEVADEARRLGGADLKAAVAWRGVIAEMAAGAGEREEAISLATAAVELATATDSLLLEAQARLALTAVLRTLGDAAASAVEAERAAAACDAKGATVLAAAARAAGRTPPASTAAIEFTHPSFMPSTPEENEALQLSGRFVEAWNRGDWDGVRALFTDDWRMDDRRRVIGMDQSSRMSLAAQEMVFRRGTRYRSTPIATRGHHLALTRQVVLHDEGEVEVESLVVIRSRDGRRDLAVMFDPDDLDAANAELDRLFAKERATEQVAWDTKATRYQERCKRAFDAGDLEAFLSIVSPTYEVVDRRSGVSADLDSAQYEEMMRMLIEQRASWIPETLATRGDHLALFRMTVRNEEPPLELPMIVLNEVDDEERPIRTVLFDVDDLDAAYAELDRIYFESRRSARFVPDTKAIRSLERHKEVFGDGRAFSAALAPSYVLRDRRSGATVDLDRGGSIENNRFQVEHGASVTVEVVASRGDYLALARTTMRNEDPPMEFPFLLLQEVDEEELSTLSVMFDIDDIDAAYEELDALYAAGEAAPNAAAWEAVRASVRSYGDQNDDVLLTDDFVLTDHRPVSFGVSGREEWTVGMDHLAELTADARLRIVHVLGLHHRGTALVISQHGMTPDGGSWENKVITVNETDAEHRAIRSDVYDVDQLDEAMTRFAELSVHASAVSFENAAARSLRELEDAFNDGNWERFEALYSEVDVSEDRRRLVGLRHTREAALAGLRGAFDRAGRFRTELIATRADRLALVRSTLRTEASAPQAAVEFELVILSEIDASGRRTAMIMFDPDDLEAAFEELDDRFAAGEAAQNARSWAVARQTVPAWGTPRRGLSYPMASSSRTIAWRCSDS